MKNKLTLTDLNNQYNDVKEDNYKYFALKINTKGNDKAEIIINSNENFENKIAYINKAYNENLTLKNAPDIISIEGWVFAQDYDGIEKTLVFR